MSFSESNIQAEFTRLEKSCRPVLYRQALRKVGNPADAHDLVQDTMVKAYHSFSSYDRNMPFVNWVCSILTNIFRDRYRKQIRRPQTYSLDVLIGRHQDDTFYSQFSWELPDSTHEPYRLLAEKVLSPRWMRALKSLRDLERQLIIARDLEGKKYSEIAEELNLPLGTVRSGLHRGRTRLRDNYRS